MPEKDWNKVTTVIQFVYSIVVEYMSNVLQELEELIGMQRL